MDTVKVPLNIIWGIYFIWYNMTATVMELKCLMDRKWLVIRIFKFKEKKGNGS